MASNEDLKSKLMSFRVAELQTLLKYAGVEHQRLRKKELQKKALKLLKKKRIVKKIKAIYKDMMGNTSDDDDYVPSDLESCFDDYKGYFDENQFPAYDDYLDGCSDSFADNYYTQQSRAEDQYFAMFTKNLDMKRLCNVRFRNLTFYEYKSDILAITPLIPKKQDDDLFNFDITFTLNQEATNALFTERSPYQALLRFCVLNNEMEVIDQLPTLLSVKVNRDVCTLPPTASSSSSSSKLGAHKRSAPVDITPNLEKNKYVNSLSIEWSVDYYTLFGIAIQLMKKHTSADLIAKLKAKGERDANVSKKFIHDCFCEDDEDEISATTLKMSLICPIGKMPITLPTRGTTCSHLQCFDGCSYIQINELKSTWICPVCSQTCLYENLFIDGYFTEILRSDKFLPDIRDVELDPDGSWRPVAQKDKTKRPNKTPETVVPENVPPPKCDRRNSVENDICLLDTLIDFFQHCDDTARSGRSDASTPQKKTDANKLPSFPSLSGNDSAALCDFDENAMLPASSSTGNAEDAKPRKTSSTSSWRNDSPPKKKNIILVDLTISDSESDDIRSLSSPSHITWSPIVSEDEALRNYDLDPSTPPMSPNSPPVYDIDSDSSYSM
jgi:hypothetical protein